MLVFLFLYNEQLPALQIIYGSSSFMVGKINSVRDPIIVPCFIPYLYRSINALSLPLLWAMGGQ